MNLNDRVYEKLSAEFDTFMDEIKLLTGDEAIKKAYEKVFKEEIVTCFECGSMSLTPKEAKALLDKKRPLDYLYDEWVGSDVSFLDMLRDVISDGVKTLEKEFSRKSREAR